MTSLEGARLILLAGTTENGIHGGVSSETLTELVKLSDPTPTLSEHLSASEIQTELVSEDTYPAIYYYFFPITCYMRQFFENPILDIGRIPQLRGRSDKKKVHHISVMFFLLKKW